MRGWNAMAARHTNADLFRQLEEAEEKAKKWETKAREETSPLDRFRIVWYM